MATLTKPPALWRRIAHAAVSVTAIVPFSFGMVNMLISWGLVLIADKIWPNATWGNCWTFVGPKLFKHGGAVLIEKAQGPMLLKVIPVPHAIMVHHLGEDTVFEMTMPLKRTKAQWIPWRAGYFPFRVVRQKKRQDSTWADL